MIEVERHRQALPAVFGGRREADPAALTERVIGLLEFLGRRYPPVLVTHAALEIAGAVERLEDFLGELGALRENGLDHIERGVREPRQIAVAFIAEDIAQKEKRLVDRSFIAWHRALSAGRNRLHLNSSYMNHLQSGPHDGGQRASGADGN